MAFEHTTVLLHETVDNLNIKPDGIYVDCTLGGAGHSEYLLSQMNELGHLYAFDRDITAIENAKEKLKPYVERGMVTFMQSNFVHIKEALSEKGISQVDGILYDLGVSSPQLDQVERGFSYSKEAPLDMRMDQSQVLTAYIVVNEWAYSDLVRIFYKYGEEKFSKNIARNIEKSRQLKPIETSSELVDIIDSSIPMAAKRKGGHPAKRVFQAIRIAVNDELNAVEQSLEDALSLIKVGGRVSVITFHSLEDRITKHVFQKASTAENIPSKLPILPQDVATPSYKLVNKKPILPTQKEMNENSRSKSAKLRVIERIKV